MKIEEFRKTFLQRLNGMKVCEQTCTFIQDYKDEIIDISKTAGFDSLLLNALSYKTPFQWFCQNLILSYLWEADRLLTEAYKFSNNDYIDIIDKGTLQRLDKILPNVISLNDWKENSFIEDGKFDVKDLLNASNENITMSCI